MGVIGSSIGGALGIGGAIFGGISASKAMKKAKNILEGQERDNEDWYNRRYNEDATQRADAQRILTATDERVRQRNRQAAGVQAVMGGTDESVAAAKEANAQATAEAASQIAAAGGRRQDQVEQQYLQTKGDLKDKLRGMEVGKAGAVAQAVQGVAQAGANMGDLF